MPIRWYDASRDDSVGMAVMRLLSVGGMSGVTMRAVARTAQMSLGTLGNHYGSKEQMLMGAARTIGHLHVDDLGSRVFDESSLPGSLAAHSPRDAEELRELRIWHDLVALGRTMRGVGEVVAAVEERHRAVLRRLLLRHRNAAWADAYLEEVWAFLQGVATEVIRPGTTLDLQEAAALAARAADVAEALTGAQPVTAQPVTAQPVRS